MNTTRDNFNVLRITGDDRREVFEEFGYQIASDRLFQLFMFKASASGKMAEMFGANYVGTDVFLRSTGYSDSEVQEGFDRVDPKVRYSTEAYIDGINRYIDDVKNGTKPLPAEFVYLGWNANALSEFSVLDSVRIAIMTARMNDPEAYTSQAMEQLNNASLFQGLVGKHGMNAYSMFDDLRYITDVESYSTIPEGEEEYYQDKKKWKKGKKGKKGVDQSTIDTIRGKVEKAREDLEEKGYAPKLGSIGFAISPLKTDSRRSRIVCAPQLAISYPSIFYPVGLTCGDYNIFGYTIPGVPFVVIGYDKYHAWSMCVGVKHTVDFFMEDPTTVETHREETININGGSPVTVEIERAQNGRPIYHNDGTTCISWGYAHWNDELSILNVLYDMGSARNMNQFRDAVMKLPAALQITYVDKHQNIAHYGPGTVPIRTSMDPRFPQLSGLEEWADGELPKPYVENPSSGYLANWNGVNFTGQVAGVNNFMYGPHKYQRGELIDDWLSVDSNITFDQTQRKLRRLCSSGWLKIQHYGKEAEPYWEFDGWKIVGDLFTQIINANPTQERTEALSVASLYTTLLSTDLNPEGPLNESFIILYKWCVKLLEKVFSVPLSIPGMTEWYHHHQTGLFGVLMKNYEGLTNYDWIGATGKTFDQLVVEALDSALVELGPRPWTMDRGTRNFSHPVFGILNTVPRVSYATIFVVEFGADGPVRAEMLFGPGISGEFSIDPNTGGPVPGPHTADLIPNYLNWDFISLSDHIVS